MRRIGFGLLALLVLGLFVIPLCGCRTSRLEPGAKAAMGWRDTADLTGPAIDLGLGSYELGGIDSPFGGPDGESTPAPAPQPDPAITQALKDLDERQAQAAERLKALDAQVASGALSPAQAEAIRQANARLDGEAQAARAAAAEIAALKTKLAELEGQGAPPWLPKDLTIPGLVTFAAAWGAYLLRKKGKAALLALIEQKEAALKQHVGQVMVGYDRLPDTASDAEVREVVSGKPPTV